MKAIVLLVSRILIGAAFVYAGVGKFLDYAGTYNYMASQNMAYIPYLLVAAALIELLCGTAIILGTKTRIAAIILFCFLIPVTGVFHAFWEIDDPALKQAEMTHFFSNLAIMGGLLALAASGAGRLSFDSSHSRSRMKQKAEEEQEGEKV